MLKRLGLLLCAGLFVVGAMGGCSKKETPGEKIGKGIDNAIDKGEKAVKDAEEKIKE